MNGEVWIVTEQRDHTIKDVSFELLAWGRRLASERDSDLCAVVMADDLPANELDKLFWHGADKVYFVKHLAFSHFLIEPEVHTLYHLVKTHRPEILLAGATTRGRTIMPYLAVLLHTGLTADCTGLEIEPETGNLLQIRPAIGGNIMAMIKTPNTRPQMATVRPKSIHPLEADPTRRGKVITEVVPEAGFSSRIQFEEAVTGDLDTASLEDAHFVVSGGLGMKNPEAFSMIEEFANVLGAAIGSSRPPVDLGWQPYGHQVGLSGKTISPDLYIACGISGAVQHLAGIQTAKNIIAINQDPEASIFQVADLGIVGDVYQVLPVLKKFVQQKLIEG